jgi:hypothetical protein
MMFVEFDGPILWSISPSSCMEISSLIGCPPTFFMVEQPYQGDIGCRMAVDEPAAAASHEAPASSGLQEEAKDQPQNPSTQPPSPTASKPTVTTSTQDNPSSESADGMATLTSPTATLHPTTSGVATGPVPLNSTLRTTSIHPSLPSVKVPATAVAGSTEPNTNPITLKTFTDAELAKYGFEKLRAQILARSIPIEAGADTTVGGGKVDEEEVRKVREETAALLKHKLEEREIKIREIEREMEEKEKIREVERKVFRKKMGNAAAGGTDA